jgi:hypothetical protein
MIEERGPKKWNSRIKIYTSQRKMLEKEFCSSLFTSLPPFGNESRLGWVSWISGTERNSSLDLVWFFFLGGIGSVIMLVARVAFGRRRCICEMMLVVGVVWDFDLESFSLFVFVFSPSSRSLSRARGHCFHKLTWGNKRGLCGSCTRPAPASKAPPSPQWTSRDRA